jgi:hypothetical protein
LTARSRELFAECDAFSFGFFPLNRKRQKSNATSGTHCHREHELAKEKLIPAGAKPAFDTFLTLCRQNARL